MPNAGAPVNVGDFPTTVETLETTTVTDIAVTNYTAGTVQCSAVFTAPASGRARIDLWTRMQGDGTFRVFCGVEVRTGSVIGSGTIIRSPADNEAVQGQAVGIVSYSLPILQTGLTPGDTYHVRTMHKVAGGTTADIFTRKLLVSPAT